MAAVLVEELVAGRVAHGAVSRPSAGAAGSGGAGRFGVEAELALGSAVAVEHLAHTLVEAAQGVRLVRDARVNALLLGGIPHAVSVGVTSAGGGVGGTALGAARLSGGVPSALVGGRALVGGGESGADRLAAGRVGVVLAVSAGSAGTLSRSGRAGRSASRAGPDAAVVGVAAAHVGVGELALSAARATVPQAHRVSLAGGFRAGAVAGSAAFTGVGVPHAGSSGGAGSLAEGLALSAASVRGGDPLAGRIGVAVGLSTSGVAGGIAGLGDGVQDAARGGASAGGEVGEVASGCASVAVPVAESGLLALTLVGSDDGAELGAHLELVIPSTLGIGVAAALAGVAS